MDDWPTTWLFGVLVWTLVALAGAVRLIEWRRRHGKGPGGDPGAS